MKLKERIKTYNFWVSLSSAVFLFLKVIGEQFGFTVDESIFSNLITSLCGILVILGIIVPPSHKNTNIQNSITNDIETNSIATENVDNQEIVQDDNSEALNNNTSDSENCDEFKNNDFEVETIKSLNAETPVINNTQENQDESQNNVFDTQVNNIDYYDESLEIKNQFKQVLNDHKTLFGDNIDLYINVLKNEIISLEENK